MTATEVPVRVAPLRWWHLQRVAEIERDIFGDEAWTQGMLWSELAAGHYYRAALSGEELVGYAGLAFAPPDEAWVNNIAVAPSARRRGIASILLNDLLERARSKNVRSVLLEVAVDNVSAQILYDSFGFDTVGIRKGYYQPSNTDAAVMRMEL